MFSSYLKAGLIAPALIARGVAGTQSTFARPPMTVANDGELNWVLTNETAHLTSQTPIPFESSMHDHDDPAATASNSTVVIDSSQLLQEIYGFGGALTESSASIFDKMSASTQEQFLEAYWGDTGHRYTLGRTHIGSCDFSLSYYTYQNQTDDFNMTTFSMDRDHEILIPFMQKVNAVVQNRSASSDLENATRLLLVSSPWTPPAWLKTCDELTCLIECTLRDEEDDKPYRSAYALYISKYIDGMAEAGLKPWAITPQNEPEVRVLAVVAPNSLYLFDPHR